MTDDRECLNAVQRLYEFLDHELDEADADAIRAHLDACEPCFDTFGVEEALRAIVRRSCAAKAPETLRMRVVTHITSTVIYTQDDQPA